MNKATIKVIKQKTKDGKEKPRPASEILKTEGNDQRNFSKTVNGWISEQRANRRAEKAFSEHKIHDWKMNSETRETELLLT